MSYRCLRTAIGTFEIWLHWLLIIEIFLWYWILLILYKNGIIKRRWYRTLIKTGHSYRTQAEIVSRRERDFLFHPKIRVKASKIDYWKLSESLVRLWQDQREITGRIGEGQYLHQHRFLQRQSVTSEREWAKKMS